jgi:hypothetical protein
MTLLHPDKRVALFAARFESESTPGLTYDVALWPDGSWGCECGDAVYRDRACKHVRRCREWLSSAACFRKVGFVTRDVYCGAHGREAGWPCEKGRAS